MLRSELTGRMMDPPSDDETTGSIRCGVDSELVR